MKRTKSINLARMRKSHKSFRLKPLIVSIAAFSLTGCSDSRKADIYSSVEHCKNDNPTAGLLCETAYQQAVDKAAKSGPKYRSKSDCESDFGLRNCVPYRSPNGAHLFMPAVAAFALARTLEDDEDEYGSSPL
ncbi:MAG: DUF1190 domain-containing protein, partial [Oleiphilaceae bacterium]|nr:DUF1190 domain-containing protein [Oleiphilaceae bacterium]